MIFKKVVNWLDSDNGLNKPYVSKKELKNEKISMVDIKQNVEYNNKEIPVDTHTNNDVNIFNSENDVIAYVDNNMQRLCSNNTDKDTVNNILLKLFNNYVKLDFDTRRNLEVNKEFLDKILTIVYSNYKDCSEFRQYWSGVIAKLYPASKTEVAPHAYIVTSDGIDAVMGILNTLNGYEYKVSYKLINDKYNKKGCCNTN